MNCNSLFGSAAAILALALLAPVAAVAAKPAAVESFDTPNMAEPGQIALRPLLRGGATEQWEQNPGREGRHVHNVINPTITPFLPPPGKATGAAVIVAPGGAFRMLSMDNEGYHVARFLADRGIAAFVLKYRLVPTLRGPNWYGSAMKEILGKGISQTPPLEATPEAVEDAKAALRLVRSRAVEWKIDPAKVGLIGFSAGAMTALGTGLIPDKASRPDFIGAIYGPMGPRSVPTDAPPMFAALALDDPLFAIDQPLGLIDAWRQAKRPVEVHLYEKGSHGFGMGATAAGPRMWAEQFIAWLKDRTFIL